MQHSEISTTQYYDEDLLFLMLELADLHDSKKDRNVSFSHLISLSRGKTNPKELLGHIINTKEDFNLDISNLSIDTNKISRTNYDDVVDEIIRLADKEPKNKFKQSLEALINEEFSFEDIKNLLEFGHFSIHVLEAEKLVTPDIIFGALDFVITVSKTANEKIISHLKNYTKFFRDEELETVYDENYLTFENQLAKMKAVILPYASKPEKQVTINQKLLGEETRFFETALALHFDHCLDLKKVFIENNIFQAIIITKEKFFGKESIKHSRRTIITENQIPLPEKTRWQDIYLTFYDDFEITIKVGEQTFDYDFEKFGLIDTRKNGKQELKKCWNLLLYLGIGKGTFETKMLSRYERLAYQQRKKELTKIIKNIFPTIKDADPFEKWDKEKQVYKIKSHVTPPKDFREDYRDRKTKSNKTSNKFADWKDSFNEQTPDIYEQHLEHPD